MMDDQEKISNLPDYQLGMALETMSVDELRLRIGQLGSEIKRIETEIEKKIATLSTAENAFKL